ncbi:MAG: transketolase [Chloroflexi bacterium]|nr:transketolase [Chloroflexota bacterium]
MVSTAELEQKAAWVRRRTFEMVISAGSGHLGGSFSSTDILVSLYYGGVLVHDPANTARDGRDRLIASKGHSSLALYPILADRGYFPLADLEGFNDAGSTLGGHPDTRTPGIETVTGSLGHGLGIGAGLALGAKRNGDTSRTYVLIGDGESQEGAIWESAMFAAQHKLSGLTVIVDNNGVSATDHTANTINVEPVVDKWTAAGWDSRSVDGHSFDELLSAFQGEGNWDRPKAVIANTIKGKGVSFMEDTAAFHHGLPSGDQIELARAELS